MKLFAIICYAVCLLMLIGYCKCVYKLCHCDFKPSYKAEVVYGIGSVTGLGAVIWWVNIVDEKQEHATVSPDSK